MYCKKCGKEIDNDALFCSHCGTAINTTASAPVQPTVAPQKPQKQKKSIFKRWWFWAVVIAFLFFYSVGSVEPAEPTEPEQPQMSESEYKAACAEIKFSDLARNPDNYKGQLFAFTGEVIQVLESGSTVELRINVTPVTYSDGEIAYYEDTIYVTLHLEDGADRILEEDVVKIYGECAGLYSYKSILGQQVSLPRIDAMYYEILTD